MRRYGIPEPYEKLKELTRGRAVTKETIREFIEGLELPVEAKSKLLDLTPHTYTGAAAELAGRYLMKQLLKLEEIWWCEWMLRSQIHFWCWVLNNPISLHFEENVGKVARYLEVNFFL